MGFPPGHLGDPADRRDPRRPRSPPSPARRAPIRSAGRATTSGFSPGHAARALVALTWPVADLAAHWSLTALVIQRLILILAVAPMLLLGLPYDVLERITRPALVDAALNRCRRPATAIGLVTVPDRRIDDPPGGGGASIVIGSSAAFSPSPPWWRDWCCGSPSSAACRASRDCGRWRGSATWRRKPWSRPSCRSSSSSPPTRSMRPSPDHKPRSTCGHSMTSRSRGSSPS